MLHAIMCLVMATQDGTPYLTAPRSEHPHLLFDKSDRARLRRRVKAPPCDEALRAVRRGAQPCFDRKAWFWAFMQNMVAGNEATRRAYRHTLGLDTRDTGRTRWQRLTQLEHKVVRGYARPLRDLALYWQLSSDAEAEKRLREIMAQVCRAPRGTLPDTAGENTILLDAMLGLVYDWTWELMSPPQRDAFRRFFVDSRERIRSKLSRAYYLQRGTFCGANGVQSWASAGLGLLAIYREAGYQDADGEQLARLYDELFRFGLGPCGEGVEGPGYFTYGMRTPALETVWALYRKGFDLGVWGHIFGVWGHIFNLGVWGHIFNL